MSSFYGLQGKLTVHDEELSGTAEVEVIASSDDRAQSRVIETIFISSSGASTLDLIVKRGTTVVFPILQAAAITDSGLQITDYPRLLKPGERITAEAGTGGILWVSIITVDLTNQQGAQNR